MPETIKQYEPPEQFRKSWEAFLSGRLKVPKMKPGFWVDDIMIYPPIPVKKKRK